MSILEVGFKGAVVVVICCGFGVKHRVRAENLSGYLANHPWDPAKDGPMIVVDPDNTNTPSNSPSVTSFDRKIVRVGTVSAIAPMNMVLIDDSLSDPPNWYDGLPQDAKVLYLLSSLSPDQLKLANGNGIGRGDLQGEQAAVFKSLLPASLSWQTCVVGADGMPRQVVSDGSVPDGQIEDLKLKIQYGITFSLSGKNNAGSSSVVSSANWFGKPGDKVTIRKDPDGSDNRFGFGVDPRRTVPNKAKPSDLNYQNRRFDVIVEVPAQTTIGGLLKAVGATTGVEILSDLRVSGLPVKAFGEKVKAGDLLQAIALCVTGTYRRVDSAYVLTSDLKGMGVRKLRFVAWKQEADKQLYAREKLWREHLDKTGLLSKMKFDSSDPLAPDGKSGAVINQGGGAISSADMTPAMRDFVEQIATRNPSNAYSTDHAVLSRQIQYTFVLPDGTPLHVESQGVGEGLIYSPPFAPNGDRDFKVDPFPSGAAANHRLLVRAESASAATLVADQALAHGFKEIWLETHQPSCLGAALKEGIKVSLVIRPWDAPQGAKTESMDFDSLGDTGAQLAARRELEPEWDSYQNACDSYRLRPAPQVDIVSPLDPDLSKRWTEFAALAHTRGLSSVVVLDTVPAGYEQIDRHSASGFFPALLCAMSEFGYAPSVRLAFLRAHGVDPLDAAAPLLYLGHNLEQPFFLDDLLAPMNSGPGTPNPDMYGVPDQWMEFRSELNTKAINALFEQLQGLGVPVLVMPRSLVGNTPPDIGRDATLWTPGQDLPTFTWPNGYVSPPNSVPLYPLTERSSSSAVRNLGSALGATSPTIAVDVSTVSPDNLPSLLDRWFVK